jgi:hypothetical protein
MYRCVSVGLFGSPRRPFSRTRTGVVNQFTARRSWSLYFPSRTVLPSISIAMPARPVMLVGYWPPVASQWPSPAWMRFR